MFEKGIKIKHWVTDCEDYDPNYKKDRPNQNTSVKQVCGAPGLLNVSTLTNTPTQGAFKLINISVEVNGIPAQAFVDTGATISIINWRLFKRTRLQLQPNSDIHISQADGVTRTCGSLQTKVRIDKLIKPVTLHVMKNFKYPLLIGLDVASLFNLLIDVKDKTIYTKFDGLQNPILVNHLEEIREHEFKKLLEHNRNVFFQHAIDLGKVAIQHKIITKSEQPISLRPYRRPLKEYEEIAEQVKELLEHKLIRTSDSPWAFPVVMVPKKDGNKRMLIDYRRLNEITLDDRQPLPHIQDMFDRLHGSRFFSTLDVAWGYWQIEMDPQSIQKTAFVTNDGHYEFLVMPFGLENAASTFQRIIQHILGELLWKGTCSFQDDILVYTKTWQEHIELLSKVFDKLRQYNMKLKLSKCIFGRTEVKYLGHIISHNQLKPDPGKVKSIQDFPRPDTVKKVRQFMGLANYYRKFVKDFSKISFPLVRLTRKNQPFIWNEEVEESFAKLKMALSTKPVLAIYNPDYPSKVYTDASKYGIGAILTQIGPDNEEHVIAYYSKTLQPHQENYSAYEMECLAVIQATDHFHVYIENQPFEIITDHAALQWLFTMKKPKPKYFRWILSLSSKSCNIVHRSGKQQTHVDALSRLPVVNIATRELQEHQQNSDLSFLKNCHTHDGVVMIKQKGVFKAVVPNSLTKKILEEYHDSLSHPSITKTCKLITQCYWWKGITTDIKNYVRSCKSCQLVKCNGICEKLNDTIMTKLRIAVLEKPRCKWSSLLPRVVKNYNSTPHDVTGFSPLFLMYGIGNVPEFADQTPITIEEARKKASLRTEQSRKSALEWYADEIISNPAIKKWEVVKEKLIQRFGSYNANPIVSASHRRLKREESIENYFQDKIRLLNQTHLTKEEKINLLTDGLPNDWKDLIVAAQPTDTTKWFHIAASIEQNRASIQFKPKNKIHLATKNNDNRKNVCPFWCPICSKKGIKIKHWVTDCEDYDPNYKKDRPNQNTSVKQVCGAPELLNVSTLTNTPTQGAFKLINISVEVNGIPAQAFVDTGATVSIINWRLFKRTRLQPQPNSDIHISQADGVTRTCGSLQTKVRIDKLIKPVTLHVMKNFKYPLLIGLDVASLFNLLIDVRDKTIYTKFDGLQNPILVNHLEEIREHELKELLEHNRNVFSQHAIDLGKVAIQHKIITKSEQPISLRPYRRPLKEYEEIAEQVKELLEHKLIRISDSPWAFPVVMVPKKDGNKRMCIDYRRLNEITLDDRQPLPHIQDMFDRLHGSRFFSTLDVAWGYWQIEMDPQSIQKTAFVTNDGHYEFLVMPFGLKNAASTFQRIIQHILGELLWKGTCSFQDDILVYTKTWQEHIELLSKVFDKLRQYNMKLKLSKCIFGRTEVKYLGHIISHNQLKPDPGKVKSIQDFPRPDTVKKVRQFMGLANYYRKFVKDFSKISFLLVRLTRKNQPFIWNEEVEESFAKLKMALSTKPVLAIYNPDYPSKVYTDASKYGIGAILTQIGPDNEEHVIAYYSKTLQPHQENYSAYEMECLAVIQATDHFHVYIENQPFEIITDHAALQWLFTMKKPKPKYFRWILSLSSKSCNIVHRSGKQQTHVDALSRLPVVNIATQELQEHQQNSDLSFLKNSHTHDGVVMIKRKGVFKAVVPNSLTKKILEEYHDSLSHPSITKTCKLLTQCYWWKGITTDIKNYVRSCKSCQLVKVRHEPTLGEMITPTSNIQPLQMIGCDTIVLGTAAANTKHKFIQVFVDHATRYLWAYPTITNTAQAVTQCLDKIIKSVNSINTILTDNGKNFISKEFNKFLSLQGIKHTYTSPYHPQCNGICEKLNDTIMTKLRIAVLEKPRCKWSTLLPQVVKNYNSTPHDVTGFSPLFLMYGIGNVPEFADQTPITIEEARKKASLRTEQIRKPDMEDKSSWEIWSDKNDEAFGIIITTLTNEQAGMFIGKTNAKKVWDSLRKTYTGNLEDKIIDIGLELKNIKMKDNETVDEYITRAKNIAARSSSLGHQFPSREFSFHIVRGIHPRFEGLFKRSGIHHQLTTTYSPQSNGVAERVNRTLIDTARTLLIDSKLPMMFWAEAIATAAYIKNCTPYRSIKHHTPMQRWNGRKPSVKHIRIFGCLTHWLESKPRRNKFSPKGRKGIFIGYSIKRKAYRIYDIMTKIIHEVRSVKFSEDKRGIDYANDIQVDTNCDNLTYKGNCEEIVEDFLILKEDNPVTESEIKSQEDTSVKPGGDTENDSTQTELIEERCAKGGRKKGETKSILEERHKARLEEQERKLIKEGVRRSQRIKDRNDANLIMEIEHYIPENFNEAMDSGERNEWHKAMEEELSEIEKHKVWTLVPRENGMKVINSKWVYSMKKTSNDGIYKRKARLVAVGCNQRYGVDYKDKLRKCADSLGLA
ncbi:hypothetical protein LAZ67_12000984, partial [Cordylochernes scorpioides]